jgi:hypothetical protein
MSVWTDAAIRAVHQRIMNHLDAPDWYYACVVLSDLASLPFKRVCDVVICG